MEMGERNSFLNPFLPMNVGQCYRNLELKFEIKRVLIIIDIMKYIIRLTIIVCFILCWQKIQHTKSQNTIRIFEVLINIEHNYVLNTYTTIILMRKYYLYTGFRYLF